MCRYPVLSFELPSTDQDPFRKRLVSQNRQYDFLDDLVQSVADPTGGADAGPSGEAKPSRGKGRAAANGGAKSSPALKPSSAESSPSLPASSAAPAADSGARAPPAGVISAQSVPRNITAPQPYGSGKGPSNASIILNSPTNTGPILPSRVPPTVKPQPDFDDYDEDDDDDDDDYDA
jgi:hypothetical protein